MSRLFVGDIKKLTKEDLDRAFNAFGEIKEIWMPRGDPGGFAFVEFFSAEAARSAIKALDNKSIGNEVVRVELSKKKPSRRFGGPGPGGPPPSRRGRSRSPRPPLRRRRRSRSHSRSPRRHFPPPSRRISRTRSRSRGRGGPRSPPSFGRRDRDFGGNSTSLLGPPRHHDFGGPGMLSSSLLGSSVPSAPYGAPSGYPGPGLGSSFGPIGGGGGRGSGDFDYSYSADYHHSHHRGGPAGPSGLGVPPPPSGFSSSYDRNGMYGSGGRLGGSSLGGQSSSNLGGGGGRYELLPPSYLPSGSSGGGYRGGGGLLDGPPGGSGRPNIRSPPPTYRGGGERGMLFDFKDDRSRGGTNGFDRSAPPSMNRDYGGPYGSSGISFRRTPPPLGRSRDFEPPRGRDLHGPPPGRSYPPPRRPSPRRY